MEKIPTALREPPVRTQDRFVAESRTRKRLKKGFLGYAGIFVSVLLLCVTVVVLTTDISVTTLADLAEVSLQFFLLLFCAYAVYVNCADSGMRAGCVTDTYRDAVARYDEKKAFVARGQAQTLLRAFCRKYVAEELRSVRENLLLEVGIPYEEYENRYLGKSKKDIRADPSLSAPERSVLLRANAVTPIRLTPDMILRRGRGNARRAPLGVTPGERKRAHYVAKFFTTCLTAVFMGVIVLEVVAAPGLETVATVMMKILMAVLNGFAGYRMGYSNVVVDRVEYMEDQCDLLSSFERYAESSGEIP